MNNLETSGVRNIARVITSAMLGVLLSLILTTGTFALDPIKVGFSAPMSGATSASGKQLLTALQLWRDDVNSKGGLLGRTIELVYYDDENNPARVPLLYRKLITEDKVDLLLGPYGTNMAAAAMRVLLEFNKVTISVLGVGVNRIFSNPKHFAMTPAGRDGVNAFSTGIFELASGQTPRPETVAILASESEFENKCAEAARMIATEAGFEIVYDNRYPKGTVDFTRSMKELQAANADVVFVAPTTEETLGLLRKIDEAALTAKLIGGSIPGLKDIAVKAQLGPLLDGLVVVENFAPALTAKFSGALELLKHYGNVSGSTGTNDPVGNDVVLYAYAAGQVLAQAIEKTNTIDSDQLADYIHAHKFETVVGPVEYDANGESTEARVVVVQFSVCCQIILRSSRRAAFSRCFGRLDLGTASSFTRTALQKIDAWPPLQDPQVRFRDKADISKCSANVCRCPKRILSASTRTKVDRCDLTDG